jgi:hypothetical protein
MTMPEGTNTPHIYGAIRAVMEQVTNVAKDGTMKNKRGEFQYNYVRSAELVSKVGTAFRTQGIMTQTSGLAVTIHQAPVSGASGSVMWTTASVSLVYRFTSLVDGSVLEFASAGEGRDGGDKSTAKALTMAYKSALQQAFNIATDDPDPDADRPVSFQAHEHAPKPPDTRTDAQRKAEEEYARRRNQVPQDANASGQAPRRGDGRPVVTPEQRAARSEAERPAQQARRDQAAQVTPADPDPLGTAQRDQGGDDVERQVTRALLEAARTSVQDDIAGTPRSPRDDATRQRVMDCLRASAATSDRATSNKIVLRAAQAGLLTLVYGGSSVADQITAHRAVSM